MSACRPSLIFPVNRKTVNTGVHYAVIHCADHDCKLFGVICKELVLKFLMATASPSGECPEDHSADKNSSGSSSAKLRVCIHSLQRIFNGTSQESPPGCRPEKNMRLPEKNMEECLICGAPPEYLAAEDPQECAVCRRRKTAKPTALPGTMYAMNVIPRTWTPLSACA